MRDKILPPDERHLANVAPEHPLALSVHAHVRPHSDLVLEILLAHLALQMSGRDRRAVRAVGHGSGGRRPFLRRVGTLRLVLEHQLALHEAAVAVRTVERLLLRVDVAVVLEVRARGERLVADVAGERTQACRRGETVVRLGWRASWSLPCLKW